jgi:putative membrane protein
MRSPGRFALAASFAAILIATAAVPVLAQGKGGTAGSGEKAPYIADHTFLVTAAIAGLEQVRLARLAVLNAVNPDVKSFAQKVIDDYGKANDQLRQLAASKGVKDLPAHPDPSTQALFDKLDKIGGEDFDVVYIRQAAEDHRAAVALFANEELNGADADVKHYAATFLPTLRDALTTAQHLEDRIAGRSSSSPSQ